MAKKYRFRFILRRTKPELIPYRNILDAWGKRIEGEIMAQPIRPTKDQQTLAWINADHPAKIFALLGFHRGLMSWRSPGPLPPRDVRRLRLFICACCREIWDQLPHDQCRAAVQVAERVADGMLPAPVDTLALSYQWALDVRRPLGDLNTFRRSGWHEAHHAVAACTPDSDVFAEMELLHSNGWGLNPLVMPARQAEILKDIYPNPFEPLPDVMRPWLEWNEGTVRRLAGKIRSTQDYSTTPILADALEEAGCQDYRLLNHFRAGKCVRGCWALDLIRGSDPKRKAQPRKVTE